MGSIDSYRRYEGAFPADLSAVAIIRGEMVSIARECQMEEPAVQDVKLAISEAASNAVLHGSQDTGAAVRVTADHEDHELTITVSDTGGGMVPRSDSPGLGLGLPLIAMVTKRMGITCEGGTAVEMVFNCPGAPATLV